MIARMKMRVILDDETVHDVTADNRDAVRFDMVRARLGWPPMKESPMLWATFMAWSALARAGVFDGRAEEELDRIVSIESLEDEEHVAADPTKAAAPPTG